MNLEYIVELIIGSPMLIFLTSITVVMILLMIMILLKHQSIDDTKIPKNELRETKIELSNDKTTIMEEPSVIVIPSSQEVNGSVIKTVFNKDITYSVTEKRDLCNHCEEFKNLGFAVCPNCGNPLNISLDT